MIQEPRIRMQRPPEQLEYEAPTRRKREKVTAMEILVYVAAILVILILFAAALNPR